MNNPKDVWMYSQVTGLKKKQYLSQIFYRIRHDMEMNQSTILLNNTYFD
jgi:hypothetical protein